MNDARRAPNDRNCDRSASRSASRSVSRSASRDDARGVLAGDRRSIARAISLIERQTLPPATFSPTISSERECPKAQALLDALYPHTRRAHIVGITGAPGTGKSTLVNQVAGAYRREVDLRVGILAVDPTSPFSGGALLGDRIRMGDLAGDPDIFIRSMATRGAVGGLSRSTFDAVQILEAAGYELILIETVGTGQDEIEIAHTAHTTVVVQAPGLGDDIQAIKAGILEIADVLVVNKADRDGVETTARALRFMLDSAPASSRESIHASQAYLGETEGPHVSCWQVPIVKTIALNGTGIDDLVCRIRAHHDYLKATGALYTKELKRAQNSLEDLLRQALLERFLSHLHPEDWESAITRVATRQISPYEALEQLLPARTPPSRT